MAWLLCLAAPALHAALIAEYRFEETNYNGTANEVADVSGNGRHARIIGAVTSSSTGRTCRGILIPNNLDDTIAALDTGIDVNTIGNAGTLTFWYRAAVSGSEGRTLFDATTSSGARFYGYRDGSGSGWWPDVDISFHVFDAGGNDRDVDDFNVMQDDQWTHIAVTWSASAGRVRLYINGSLMDSESYFFSGGAIHSSIGTLYIGDNRSNPNQTGRNNSANGWIDQVRIYNHELTGPEISTDYAASPACIALHHLELTSTSASGAPGADVTFTVKACANASCSTLYTGGVTGNLTGSGVGMTVTYPSGAAFTIPAGSSSTTVVANISPGGTTTMGLASVAPVAYTSPAVYCGMGVAAASGNSCVYTTLAAVRHLELTTTAASGVACNPVTFTIKACANADCSSTYTGGLTGNLSVSGPGMTVNYPAGAGFSITAGSATTTVSAHVTTVGSVSAALTGLSITPSNVPAVFCGMGAPAASGASCTYTTTQAGLLFDVADHLADTTQPFTVSAVRSSDNGLQCTPAFASVSRTVNFRCSYTNPGTGTLPARVGGVALNAANNASAACDGIGGNVSLSFNGSGVASTTVRYADAGRITLTATYSGSGSDAGLTMSGNDQVISAPFDFALSSVTAGPTGAGSPFSATVTARNYSGTATPNFGLETVPQGVTLGFVRAAPTGAGAVSGSFSGSLGSFSAGVATASNLTYSEAGRIDVVATQAGYLGTSFRPAGSSHGAMVWCANEGGTCTLPPGTLNTVYYAAVGVGSAYMQTGLSGSVGCNNATFGDPRVGTGKGCWYVTTSGVSSANTGVATFRPHHFDLTATAACAAGGFSYAGQPFGATVTARNAAGATTINYDGSAATSPNFARAVTLSEIAALGLGTLSGQTLAASAFTAGVATASPSYAFTAKQTAPQSLALRATDTDATSSAGFTETSMPLRSGRLRLSNAYGRASSALLVPVTAEYWSGASWVLNAADSCTSVPAASVVTSNPRSATGATSAATSSVSAITLAAGRGNITLGAPSPAGSSLSLDLALNLGGTTADQSCLASHPASTGANRAWLRSRNGSCSAGEDRDPAARASFGIYAPETRKTVHVRELF